MILGASWVDKGSTKRARKATRAPRRALGTCMEAKCSNMEQNAKIIDLIVVFLMILGSSWVENGSTKRARKATRGPRRALGTGMEAKGSKIEQNAKRIDLIYYGFLMIWQFGEGHASGMREGNLSLV